MLSETQSDDSGTISPLLIRSESLNVSNQKSTSLVNFEEKNMTELYKPKSTINENYFYETSQSINNTPDFFINRKIMEKNNNNNRPKSELQDTIQKRNSQNAKFTNLEKNKNKNLSNDLSIPTFGLTKYLKSKSQIKIDENESIVNVDPKIKIPKLNRLNSKFMSFHELEIPIQIREIEPPSNKLRSIEDLPRKYSSETPELESSTEHTPKDTSINSNDDKGYYSDTPLTEFGKQE